MLVHTLLKNDTLNVLKDFVNSTKFVFGKTEKTVYSVKGKIWQLKIVSTYHFIYFFSGHLFEIITHFVYHYL